MSELIEGPAPSHKCIITAARDCSLGSGLDLTERTRDNVDVPYIVAAHTVHSTLFIYLFFISLFLYSLFLRLTYIYPIKSQ